MIQACYNLAKGYVIMRHKFQTTFAKYFSFYLFSFREEAIFHLFRSIQVLSPLCL